VNWFGVHLYWGRGDNLDSILLISPGADLSDLYLSLECRNAVYNPSQGAGMQASNSSGCRNDILLQVGGKATHSSALGLQIHR
jgi:hypothetical protein